MTQNDQPSAPLVDRVQMGRLFRAARIVAGFDRVEDAAAAIQERTGLHLTARTLYALERGEQSVTLEHLFAVVMTYDPPGAVAFFNGAYREDLALMLARHREEIKRGGA